MKYLKTYKLFERYINGELYLYNPTDSYDVNDNISVIRLMYKTTMLDELPKKLKILDCKSNNGWLYRLPKLPPTLEELYCDNNVISRLPELPDSLKILSCYNNKLNKLSDLPEKLTNLYCENNNLKELPDLPESLKILHCYNNPLKKLPKGINNRLLEQNNNNGWINENAYKWIIKQPNNYNILKDYLSNEEKEKLEKIHPEILSQDQFGMFGLKNDK